MRIISGTSRGKKLCQIRGQKIRPTSDRLRESIFNILAARLQGSCVLDLFAGTGAMGIEALSRGAKSAVFIDKLQDAISAVQMNLNACKLMPEASVKKWDIIKNLDCLCTGRYPKFDLVFIDPPYKKEMVEPALANLFATKSLKQNALIIVEHSIDETLPDNLPGFLKIDRRKYGKTLVTFFNYDRTIDS